MDAELQLAIVVAALPSLLLAGTVTADLLDSVQPRWFIHAFIGVFGFEIVLKRVNVTFSDSGVLTINDWITSARDTAVAHAVEADVKEGEKRAQNLAQRLARLDDAALNAHVINLLGQQQLTYLDAAAQNGGADPGLIKGLALAKMDFKVASAIETP